jgi:hypothetical protein
VGISKANVTLQKGRRFARVDAITHIDRGDSDNNIDSFLDAGGCR